MTRSIKSKGFLMAETVFAIFITALSLIVLQCVLTNLRVSKNSHHRTDEIAFTYIQLERFFNEKGTVSYLKDEKSNHDKAVIHRKDGHDEKDYVISQYRDMLRMTTTRAGHMPLLLDINHAEFSSSGRILKIKIEEKDGRSSELYFKLQERPKEKEKVKKKSSTKKSKS